MGLSMELREDEKIIKKAKPTRWKYLWWYVGAIICLFLSFFIVPVFIAILLIALAELKRRGHTYVLTNKRIIHEYTFISRDVATTSYDKVQDAHLNQTFLDRLLNIGSVLINTAGTTFIEIRFDKVGSPIALKKIVDKRLS